MKRFFVDKITDTLTDQNHRHITVCRLKAGDGIVLCTGDGADHIGVIKSIGKTQTHIAIQKSVPNDTEPDIALDLYFAPLSSDNTELVIIKGTELGVRNFWPIQTKYTQANSLNLRYDRLNKLTLEACKQCGRARLPVINRCAPLDFTAVDKYDAALLCYEREREHTVNKALPLLTNLKKIALFIGPEGGFHADEVTAARSSAGLRIVTLGKRILRAETAAIAAAAIIINKVTN